MNRTSLRSGLLTAIILSFLFLPAIAAAKEIPMWEGVSLTAQQKAANEKLIADVSKATNGNVAAGAQRAIQVGWQRIGEGDIEGAIRRFNQAWLLAPQNGSVYWGFAVATGIRGDQDAVIDRFFKKANTIVGDDARLFSDWGRVYEQRNKLSKAKVYFNEAAKLDPKNPEPHIGLIRVGMKSGDKSLVNQQKKILNSLGR